ncbi:biotin carboxylase [Salibacteraceae bacterium]|jgi:D-alanine-D-alanine ligase-like ATP-grasp enzyme|nr:biotin carboxylase [Flavobacteriales bacterium]MDB9701101.1 biotin carboxylase [Salibacteraceae bacterium]
MAKKKTSKVEKIKKLRGVHDLRRFFYKNETPIYFISATNFNLLGADEWIKGFKFITYINCFDGKHPNVFTPQEEMPHADFESIEDIVNYLLEHKEVVDFIKSRGDGGKALFLMFDEKTEELAKQLGLESAFPSASLRTHLDNKVVTNRVAEKANVPAVPNVLTNVDSFETLRKVSKHLGDDLVVQTPFGDSGHTTFFISNEEEWKKHAAEIIAEDEVKVMKRINCMGAAMEACVTRHGTIVAPLMTELVGFKELTPYKGGWCGNEIYADCFTPKIRRKAKKYTEQFGNQLLKEGYKGYFELDFLIDTDTGELYLGELNPRITGASSITNHAVFALADAPLFLFHIMEYMDRDYQLSVNAINQRWHLPENIDEWGQMVIKHTEESIEQITTAPRSGIYKIDDNGAIHFDRMDTHRRAVETEQEAFFLRILKAGDYIYEGADMGILVVRGRLMTDDFQLRDRARTWIDAMRGEFVTVEAENRPHIEEKVAEIGGFKMM